MDEVQLVNRRAIEALRNGVPNSDVVRLLIPEQPRAIRQFDRLLETIKKSWIGERQAPGMLVKGGFGTGKSHLLEYFENFALERNFIVSRIVVNKETPLYDPVRLFRICVASAIAPGYLEPALVAINHTYNTSTDEYWNLLTWAEKQNELDPRIAATLFLMNVTLGEPEWRLRIINEWSGFPMKVSDIKRLLKTTSEHKKHEIKRPLKMPLTLRLEFISRFLHSAGFSGWMLLFDEAEMISRYSIRQRGKAYAHLAQLLGLTEGLKIPGISTVFTITDDYASQVLFGRKNDIEKIPEKLPGTKDEEYIPSAIIGMNYIESKGIELLTPDKEQMKQIYNKVRSLYSTAYDWEAPEFETRLEHALSTRMRQHVRSWVNIWDLLRMYDYEAEIVTEEIETKLDEDKEYIPSD